MRIQMLGICLLLLFSAGCGQQSQEKAVGQLAEHTESITREGKEDSEEHRRR